MILMRRERQIDTEDEDERSVDKFHFVMSLLETFFLVRVSNHSLYFYLFLLRIKVKVF